MSVEHGTTDVQRVVSLLIAPKYVLVTLVQELLSSDARVNTVREEVAVYTSFFERESLSRLEREDLVRAIVSAPMCAKEKEMREAGILLGLGSPLL